MSLFYAYLWLFWCPSSFSWKVFLIFLNLMFLINSTKSFSKGISSLTCLGLYGDFSSYHSVFYSMLLSLLSLLLKCIAFHLILVITISTFSINCNKYLLSEGIGTRKNSVFWHFSHSVILIYFKKSWKNIIFRIFNFGCKSDLRPRAFNNSLGGIAVLYIYIYSLKKLI